MVRVSVVAGGVNGGACFARASDGLRSRAKSGRGASSASKPGDVVVVYGIAGNGVAIVEALLYLSFRALLSLPIDR